MLYKEVVLEHNKKPLNFGQINPHTHQQLGHNPLCGDKLILSLNIVDNSIQNIGFEGEGCAIMKATTSILTDLVKGSSLDEAQFILKNYLHFILSNEDLAPADKKNLGKMAVFEGVKSFPERIKCALLSARTLESIIQDFRDK